MVEMTRAEDVNSLKIEDTQYVQYATFFPLCTLATRHFQYSVEEQERKITFSIFRSRNSPQDRSY